MQLKQEKDDEERKKRKAGEEAAGGGGAKKSRTEGTNDGAAAAAEKDFTGVTEKEMGESPPNFPLFFLRASRAGRSNHFALARVVAVIASCPRAYPHLSPPAIAPAHGLFHREESCALFSVSPPATSNSDSPPPPPPTLLLVQSIEMASASPTPRHQGCFSVTSL